MKRSVLTLIIPVIFTLLIDAPGQVAIPVGNAGSYASYPPLHEGDGVAAMLTNEIYVVDEIKNTRPIPSNDWWSDMLFSQFAGDMWALPLTVSAKEEGINISHPTNWNATGENLQIGTPLTVQGTVPAVYDPSDIIFEDFEDISGFPAGWTAVGTAFGSGVATGALAGQGGVSGFLGTNLINSFNGGDGPTGTLVSTAFVIDRDYLHFKVGGGNHSGTAEVQLVVSGAVVMAATGDNSENLAWQTWDVSGLLGSTAHVEIMDNASGGWGHILADHFFFSDDTNTQSKVSGDFSGIWTRARDWDDWRVDFRLAHDSNRFFDVTFGHGFPFIWIGASNVAPVLNGAAGSVHFDDSGSAAAFPTVTNRIGFENSGQIYGVYLPDGTTVSENGNDLQISFSGADQFVIIGVMTSRTDLAAYADYAYARPIKTQMDWQHDTAAGTIETTWTVDTEPMNGTATNVMMGWLPHHYRGEPNPSIPFNGTEYFSPRGILKLATGNTYSVSYPFKGILPITPPPGEYPGVSNAFDSARMDWFIDQYALITDYGAETYFGNQHLARYGQYLNFADQMGNNDSYAILKMKLTAAMEDWLTYTPGETERYYAAYTNYRALVGFNESFYSFQFTDHHFHYGYHVYAGALLAMQDTNFVANYGPMLKLVSKEYANWERSDTNFPFLRTFDPWIGHSYAGGTSSPGGNNQESASEGIQSSGALFLLGQILCDTNMSAAGAMMHAMETVAYKEYWNDYYGWLGGAEPGNFADEYTNTTSGFVLDNGQAYATFFSGDPAWIYGISWITISPILEYLGKYPDLAQSQYDTMMSLRSTWGLIQDPAITNSISQMGAGLGNAILSYLMHFNVEHSISEFEELWNAADPVATENHTGGMTYYFGHAYRFLGDELWDWHMDLPMSTVYFSSNRNEFSYSVYNPKPDYQRVNVYSNGTLQGWVAAPGYELSRFTNLYQDTAGFVLLDADPQDSETDVHRFRDEITLIFSKNVDSNSLAGITLTGTDVSGLTYLSGHDTHFATFRIDGTLAPSATYQIFVPSTVATTEGGGTLGSNSTFSFSVEAQPAIQIIDSSPTNNAVVSLSPNNTVTLHFNARMNPDTFTNVFFEQFGSAAPFTLQVDTNLSLPGSTTVVLNVTGSQMLRDEAYRLVIPTDVQDIYTNSLSSQLEIVFTTEGGALPSAILFENYNADGYEEQIEAQTDFNFVYTNNPYEGYFCTEFVSYNPFNTNDANGTGPQIGFRVDNDEEITLNLTNYTHVEMAIRSEDGYQWQTFYRSGDPSTNIPGTEMAGWVGGITDTWNIIQFPLAPGRDAVNKLITMSIHNGRNLYLDNVRLVSTSSDTGITVNAGAILKNSGVFRVDLDGPGGPFMNVQGDWRLNDKVLEITESGSGGTESEYILITYTNGARIGEAFAETVSVPADYVVDYQVTGQVRLLRINTNLLVTGVDGSTIPDESLSPLAAAGTDFGDVNIGANLDKTLTITNLTGSAINLTDASIVSGNTGSFSVVSYPASIPSGGSGSLVLRFSPPLAGPQQAIVAITDSVTPGDTYNFQLLGNGVGATAGIALDPATRSETDELCAEVASSFGIRNDGGDPLVYSFTLNDSWLSSPDEGQVFTNDPAFTRNHDITLSSSGLFCQAGTYTGSVTVTADYATNSPQTLVVEYTVTDPSASSITANSLGDQLISLDIASGGTPESMVVYREGSPLTGGPANCSVYNVGDSLGGGTIIYAGPDTVLEHQVSDGADHYYAVFGVQCSEYYSAAVSAQISTALLDPSRIYEPFAYTGGVALVNQYGGTGWTNAWEGGTETYLTTNTFAELSGGPLHQGYAAMSETGNGSLRGFEGFSNGSLYISFQFRYATNAWAGLSLFEGNIERLFIGEPAGGANAFGMGFANMGNDTMIPGEDYTIIARYDFDNDMYYGSIFTNASGTMPLTEPVSWDISGTDSNLNFVNRIRLAGSAAAGAFVFDEIRIAASWIGILAEFPINATNYAIGTAYSISDAALTAGSYTVSFEFQSDDGVKTNGSLPAYSLRNPNSSIVLSEEPLSSLLFKAGGLELAASNSAGTAISPADIQPGTWSLLWSALTSNDVSVSSIGALGDGTPTTFTVVDDDTDCPETSGFSVKGDASAEGQVSLSELALGSWSITGLVRDTYSGINVPSAPTMALPDASPHLVLKDPNGIVRFSSVFDTLAFADGGAVSYEPIAHLSPSGISGVIAGTWTAEVYIVDNDTDFGTNGIDDLAYCAASVAFEAVGGGGALDTNDFSRMMRISFCGYDKAETLTDFPVLVRLHQGLTNFLYEDFASTMGGDLRFASEDFSSELTFEIENWDTNGESQVWVKVPGLSSGAYIWALWGNTNDTFLPPYTANGETWSEDYTAVWHLDETAGDHADSTANGITAYPSNGVVQNATGLVATGDAFLQGTADKAFIPNGTALDILTNDFTVSAFIRPHILGGNKVIFGTTWQGFNGWSLRMMGTELGLEELGDSGNFGFNSGYTLSPNVGYWVTAVFNETNTMKFYVDGVEVSSADGTTGPSAPATVEWYIGANTGDEFDGVIDEVRVAHTSRGSNWIWAAQMSAASNGVFTCYDEVVDLTDGGPVDPDSDADGLPDAWELLYAGSITNMGIGSNSDSDDLTDIEEYILDTHPGVSNGPLLQTQFSLSAGFEYVTFTDSSTGRMYSVDYSTNSLIGSWFILQSAIPGSNGATTVSDPVPAGRKYFRVRALKPTP